MGKRCWVGIARTAEKRLCGIATGELYSVGAAGNAAPNIPRCVLSSESGLCGLEGGFALVEAYSGGESAVGSLSDDSAMSQSENGVPSGDGFRVAAADATGTKRPRSSLGWFRLVCRLAYGCAGG